MRFLALAGVTAMAACGGRIAPASQAESGEPPAGGEASAGNGADPREALVALAAGLANPYDIAVDATNVYWTQSNANGTVLKMALAGGSPDTLAREQDYPQRIAVDSTHVYWTTRDGDVWRVPIAGGVPALLVTGRDGQPGGLAVDAANVYWSTGAGDVMKMGLSGGSPIELAPGDDCRCIGTGNIAVNSQNVYWTKPPGTLMQVPVAGGAPTTRISGEDSDMGPIALDATSVYWSGGAAFGTVMNMPLAEGGFPRILASAPYPAGLALDATGVYWTDYELGAVMKVPLDGGAPVTLASDQRHPGGVAVSGTNVYWLNRGSDPSVGLTDGSLMRLSLP